MNTISVATQRVEKIGECQQPHIHAEQRPGGGRVCVIMCHLCSVRMNNVSKHIRDSKLSLETASMKSKL